MYYKKSLIILFAVFIVAISASVVSAGTVEHASNNHHNDNAILIDGTLTNSTNSTIGNDLNLNNTSHNPAAGSPVVNPANKTVSNETQKETPAQNTTNNTTPTHNTNNMPTAHASNTRTLPSTGNPIIALLAVIALIGSYSIIKRN